MPSPNHRSKSASTSSRTGVRTSPRRDDPDSRNPVPVLQRPPVTPPDQYYPLEESTPERKDSVWSRLNVPPLNHSRSGSHLHTDEYTDSHFSPRPSIVMTSMSSMPSLRQDQKKSGGFKATIKRMFGSKRHRSTVHDARKGYHMSDPGDLMGLGTASNHHISAPVSTRPRTALQRTAAASYTTQLPSDMHAFQSSHTRQPSNSRPRRNTLPSLTFSEHEAQSFSKRLGQFMEENPDNGPKNDAALLDKDNRRSKSADALVEKFRTDAQRQNARQDRDSEIAFWRNSILLNPLPKSTSHESVDTQKHRPVEQIKETPSLEHILKPAQSFDFGLASPAHESNDLEDRVTTLEVKMFDFEYAIARLQGVEIPKPVLPTKRTKRKNVQEVFAKPSIQSLSSSTSGQEIPPITPKDSPLLSQSFDDSFNSDRTSKATVRPLVMSTTPPRSSLRLTAEQFDSLMAMIQDEKDARQLMELQVLDLQKELELLRTPVYATINYPTPSPESTRRASTQKKLHRSPPFQLNKLPYRETSRFSMTESDTESVNDRSDDSFRTPHQRHYDFGSPGSALVDVAS